VASRRTFKILYVSVFGLAALLRFSLVLFNREANDAHETVASLILQTGRLPLKDDCWECFQPKLYHLVFAKSLQITGLEGNPGYQQNVAGQAVNFLAGMATLAIVYAFITGLAHFDDKAKVFSFALVALNPSLVGINSQATNDSFVILLSTAAAYFAYVFLRTERPRDLALVILLVVLGVSTKANAWVTFGAISLALLLRAYCGAQRARAMRIAVLFPLSVIVLSLINPLGQYLVNLREYGSPLLLNINRDPLPGFSGEYSAGASGIWYLGDGFLTFRVLDLMEHPRLDLGTAVYLPHQTSFWTMLYGRAHSIHFDNAPPSWSTTGTELFPFMRALYLLAIVPTSLLLFGAGSELFALAKGLFARNREGLQAISYGLFVLLFLGYISFQVLYSLQYRSVTVIKSIFLLPALLSFPALFLGGHKILYTRLARRGRWPAMVLDGAMVGLLVCYVIDATILIRHLADIYAQKHFFQMPW
jgi:hypothetical protein